MRILVAGASGAIGRPLVALLVNAGHSVVGLTRSRESGAALKRLGAEHAVADGLDASAIGAAVSAANPDVVVHEMTSLKGTIDLQHFDRTFAMSNRLRIEGTRNLLEAAKRAGVRRFVAQSYCGWPYARTGGMVKTESAPLDSDPPREFKPTLDAIRYVESAVTRVSGIDGIVLRYGGFYGADTGVFDGPMLEQVRRRRVPIIGDGNGWWSFVETGDAARATVLAIERGLPGDIYNIVDDDPAPVREWLPALAQMLGAKPPRRVPAWLARLFACAPLVLMMTEIRAGSNAKAKAELGWQPAFRSWRQGFAEVLRDRLQHREAA